MTLPPFLVAYRGFMQRHGPRCQARPSGTYETDLRLPRDHSQDGAVTFRCSCGWETEAPIDYPFGRWIGIILLYRQNLVTITTIDAGGGQCG